MSILTKYFVDPAGTPNGVTALDEIVEQRWFSNEYRALFGEAYKGLWARDYLSVIHPIKRIELSETDIHNKVLDVGGTCVGDAVITATMEACKWAVELEAGWIHVL